MPGKRYGMSPESSDSDSESPFTVMHSSPVIGMQQAISNSNQRSSKRKRILQIRKSPTQTKKKKKEKGIISQGEVRQK